MADVKFSELTPATADSLAFVPAISSTPANFLVALNTPDGLVIVDASGNILPASDGGSSVGTDALRVRQLSLSLAGSVLWNDGAGGGSFLGYQAGVGPQFFDVTAASFANFDIHHLTTDRTFTFPDVDGTVTVGGNTTNPTQVAPTTGGTVTVTPAGAVHVESINPAGTLANLTLAINDGSYGGQIVFAAFSQVITALAYGGTNITATGGLALPAAATLGQCMGFVWSAATSKWTRFQ